jgi:hypothetical protein
MADKVTYDFSGYATKNNLKCSDGRTILKDAFKHQNGLVVPLVWQHLHNEAENILGHALLENREDGVYVYAQFNETKAGQHAKMLVQHGDITALSIYANQLAEKAKSVIHGVIREVSLVLAGANPGARIDNMTIAHGDGSEDESAEDAVIYTNEAIKMEELTHADATATDVKTDGETVGDVFNTLSEKQKNVVYAMIAEALDQAAGSDGTMAQADGAMAQADDTSNPDETVGDVFNTLSEKQKNVVYAMIAEAMDQASNSAAQSATNSGDNAMKHNVFDKSQLAEEENTLTHEQTSEIIADAVRYGSLKDSFLQHVDAYGIDHPEYMFPDARAVAGAPSMIQRRMDWVAGVLSGTYHTPFSRIKSLVANITEEEARAKGYIKGNLKKDEVIKMLRRTTTPTTIYKKQKLDRDDITDITDFNVVTWLKGEMRAMLDEEAARAILIGDGRDGASIDHINDENIRPIYTDDALYSIKVELDEAKDAEDFIEAVLRSRENYGGSGNPTMYTTTGFLNDMLLLKDTTNRRLYATLGELETVLRVGKIVEVPVMNGVTRDVTVGGARTLALRAIIVNLKDYTVGADKGGEVSLFDDFDIDFNQQKFLIETRMSGALSVPYSAIVIEQVTTAG